MVGRGDEGGGVVSVDYLVVEMGRLSPPILINENEKCISET